MVLRLPESPARAGRWVNWRMRFPDRSKWLGGQNGPFGARPHTFTVLSYDKKPLPSPDRLKRSALPPGWVPSVIEEDQTPCFAAGRPLHDFPDADGKTTQAIAEWMGEQLAILGQKLPSLVEATR